FRLAEALAADRRGKAAANVAAGAAHQEATRLGATRLAADIRALARRCHLTLALTGRPAGRPEPVSEAERRLAEHQLTPRAPRGRRRGVAGRTTRLPAREWGTPSEKPASAHVSTVLRKPGVDTRTQAAALGHELGIRPDRPVPPASSA